MNNETLKRDLCARLMDGVKVKDEDALLNPIAREVIGIDGDKIIMRITRFPYRTYGNFKDNLPYLFQTSALTKEIQIASYNNGEPFVPLDIFKKKANELKNTSEDYMFDFNCVNNYIGLSRGSYDNFEGIDIFDEEHKCVNAPFWVIELLNQWHINYRLSPEQFIEVTDEFNPYK